MVLSKLPDASKLFLLSMDKLVTCFWCPLKVLFSLPSIIEYDLIKPLVQP